MVIKTERFWYTGRWDELSTRLVDLKAYVNETFSAIEMETMYGLDGERGEFVLEFRYASLAELESVEAKMDADAKYEELLHSMIPYIDMGRGRRDRFFRTVG